MESQFRFSLFPAEKTGIYFLGFRDLSMGFYLWKNLGFIGKFSNWGRFILRSRKILMTSTLKIGPKISELLAEKNDKY